MTFLFHRCLKADQEGNLAVVFTVLAPVGRRYTINISRNSIFTGYEASFVGDQIDESFDAFLVGLANKLRQKR